jgi:hypothetical protein
METATYTRNFHTTLAPIEDPPDSESTGARRQLAWTIANVRLLRADLRARPAHRAVVPGRRLGQDLEGSPRSWGARMSRARQCREQPTPSRKKRTINELLAPSEVVTDAAHRAISGDHERAMRTTRPTGTPPDVMVPTPSPVSPSHRIPNKVPCSVPTGLRAWKASSPAYQ